MSTENIVLGTVLADPHTAEEVTRLRLSDFSNANKNLFDIITALNQDNSLSYRAVVETLRDKHMLEFIGDTEDGGEDYLRKLLGMADVHGIKSHVKRLEERTMRRNLREIAALIASEANDENREVDVVMDEAERRIFNLRRRTEDDESTPFIDVLHSYMPMLDGLRSGDIQPAWIPPLKALRDLVQYVDRTDFVVIAGRPGDGKSSLLRYQALKTVLGDEENGIAPMPVLTLNLENDPFEYIKFALCTITGINSAKLKSPQLLDEEEYEQIKRAAQFLQEIPWRFITKGHPTVSEIERVALREVAQGAKLIQLDYIQLISNAKRNRVEDIADTTGALRGLALKAGVPVVAASQLSRKIEARGELAEPQLSDLRESGSIEQDATQVWFVRSMWHKDPTSDELTDPEFYFPENFINNTMSRTVTQAVPIRIFVRKNRNGPVGVTSPIKWNKANGRFSSIERRPF